MAGWLGRGGGQPSEASEESAADDEEIGEEIDGAADESGGEDA